MTNPAVTRYPAEAIARAASTYPTPFFLYEEDMIRRNCRLLKDAFAPLFPGFTPLFAVKANPNPHILKIIQAEGFGFDCSSPSEVWLAEKLKAFGMDTGNYVSERDLRQVLASGLLLNLDDLSMLETVVKIGVPEFLSFRINPGIASATLKSNLLAGPDAKYGVPWEQATEAYRRAKAAGVRRFGIHMMTGSNVASPDYFPGVTHKLLQIAGAVKRDVGIDFEYLNIGGGFNVPYRPEEPTFDLAQTAKEIHSLFDDELPRWDMKEPKLMIEPGYDGVFGTVKIFSPDERKAARQITLFNEYIWSAFPRNG